MKIMISRPERCRWGRSDNGWLYGTDYMQAWMLGEWSLGSGTINLEVSQRTDIELENLGCSHLDPGFGILKNKFPENFININFYLWG